MTKLRRRVEAIIAREMEDGILLLNSESDKIHQLNMTASFIWRQCNGADSAAEISASLVQNCDVEEEVAARDVVETLSKLRALNLVVEA